MLQALLSLSLAAPTYSQTCDSLNPGADTAVYCIALQTDGKILLGGLFTTLGGQAHKYCGRLNADGTVDTEFEPGSNNPVNCMAVQPDGKILLGGDFFILGGKAIQRLARINANSSLDTSFNSSASSAPCCLAVQADGKILVGGFFTTLSGQTCNYLGRLNTNGTLDATFNPRVGGATFPRVYSVIVQAGGSMLVAGGFTTLGGQARSYIGRLNAYGTADGFNPGADANVYCMAVQADGKILVGGAFGTLGGQQHLRLGRINAEGTLDNTFNASPNGVVNCLAVQTDGKILVGGYFTTVGGQPRNHIARLNNDGTTDLAFNPGASGGGDNVRGLAIQADGKILVGGFFTTLAGQACKFIGRLNNTDPATQQLTFDGSSISWLRGGTSPEVSETSFDSSTNGATWISLGTGTRTTDGWQLAGLALPGGVSIRARGTVNGGYGTSWFVESWFPQRTPSILANDGGFGLRSNQFGFNFNGSAGQIVVVEGSTDLLNWTSLATNSLGTGPLFFSDPQNASLGNRFYRLMTQ